MKQSFRSLVGTLVFALGIFLPLSAQEGSPEDQTFVETRTMGSQIFQLDLGGAFPLFSYTLTDPIEVKDMNLDIGVAGHIRWSTFFNDTLAIGVDLGGSITTGPNGKTLANLLLGPRFSAVFRAGNFQIPVSLTPAFSVLNYNGATYAGLAARPEVGCFWNIDKDWAVGVNFGYDWVPEFYLGDLDIPASEQRVGNYGEVTLSIMYSF